MIDRLTVMATIVGAVGLMMLLVPGFFVRIFIGIAKFNYEQSLDKYGKPKDVSVAYLNEKLGVNNLNLSKPPSAIQKWLIRILGISLLTLTYFMFIQIKTGRWPQ